MNEGGGSDMVFGSVVLALFLVFVFAFGYAIYRFKNARLTRAWRPLLPLFEGGQTAGDGGGAAASFLRGRHRGRRFDATMSPGVNVYNDSDGGGPRFNLFELALLDVTSGQDWCVNLRESGSGPGNAQWRLDADDAQLAQALRDAGVLDAVTALVRADYTIARHRPVLACRRADGRLVLRSDAGNGLVPPRDWVEQALSALLQLAEVNARLNPPAPVARERAVNAPR
jgi:hypothetical protein